MGAYYVQMRIIYGQIRYVDFVCLLCIWTINSCLGLFIKVKAIFFYLHFFVHPSVMSCCYGFVHHGSYVLSVNLLI